MAFKEDIQEVIKGFLDQKEAMNKMEEEMKVLKTVIKKNMKPTTDFKYFKNWMWNELIQEYRNDGFEDEEIMAPCGYIMQEMMNKILEKFREIQNDKEKIEEVKNKEINKEFRMIDEVIGSAQ